MCSSNSTVHAKRIFKKNLIIKFPKITETNSQLFQYIPNIVCVTKI